MRKKKTREELVNAFFLNTSEIQRLFGLSREMSKKCFKDAQRMESTSINYSGTDKVKLSTVLYLLDISETELRRKIKGPSLVVETMGERTSNKIRTL